MGYNYLSQSVNLSQDRYLKLEYVQMQKLAELYREKAEMVYPNEDLKLLILTFRNDTSAVGG